MLSSYRGNSNAPAGATSGKPILVSVDGLSTPAPVLIVAADSPYSIPEDLSSGQMYMLGTAGGALTLTLPAAPSDGQQIIFKRITTDGNTVTIARNGKLIEGAASNYTNASTALAGFTLEYSSTNGSWWLVSDALSPASSVAVGNITGLGTGVATWLATPSSTNLAAAVTGETGSGSLVFDTQPVFANTIGVGGATASTSGSGITFPATQAASTNANTLDDYEEGTWTPTDQSGAGISFDAETAGSYTKIGNNVNYRAIIIYPATGDGATSIWGPLPFTVTASRADRGAGAIFTNGGTAAQCVIPFTATTTIQVFKPSGALMSNAEFSGATILFGGNYAAA